MTLLTAPSGHWADDTSIFVRMGLRRKPSSWHISTRADAMMSPQDTSAQLSSWLWKPSYISPRIPHYQRIPIEWVNTHSLQSGSANALALSGYLDTQIQKMGCWRGATFKEYVWNELVCFSFGMSQDMKQTFALVNVSDNAFSDITDACVNAEYSAPSPLAVM
jgi:hypothetical protein